MMISPDSRTATFDSGKARAGQSFKGDAGNSQRSFKKLTGPQLEVTNETAATWFETGRQTTFSTQADAAAKAAAIMQARLEAYVRPVTLGLGRLIAGACGNVTRGADLEYFKHPTWTRNLAPSRTPAMDEGLPFWASRSS